MRFSARLFIKAGFYRCLEVHVVEGIAEIARLTMGCGIMVLVAKLLGELVGEVVVTLGTGTTTVTAVTTVATLAALGTFTALGTGAALTTLGALTALATGGTLDVALGLLNEHTV